MGGAPPLLGMNILYSMCTMRALQVDRLQRRKVLAAAELEKTGRHNESSASGQAPEEEGPGRRVQRSQLRLAPPNGIHSSSSSHNYAISCEKQVFLNLLPWLLGMLSE